MNFNVISAQSGLAVSVSHHVWPESREQFIMTENMYKDLIPEYKRLNDAGNESKLLEISIFTSDTVIDERENTP